jgi:hypothetical protein
MKSIKKWAFAKTELCQFTPFLAYLVAGTFQLPTLMIPVPHDPPLNARCKYCQNLLPAVTLQVQVDIKCNSHPLGGNYIMPSYRYNQCSPNNDTGTKRFAIEYRISHSHGFHANV